MRKFFTTAIFIFIFPFFLFAQDPSTSLGASDSSSLIADIQAQIAALQTRIEELRLSEGMPSLSSAGGFTRDLFRGAEGDDVRALQEFLAKDVAVYPEGLITGYFGTLTEKAAQRFQEKYGIVAAGSPETTGFGRVGPKTRAKLNELSAKLPIAPEPPQALQETPPPTEEQIAEALPEKEIVALPDVTATTSAPVVAPPKPIPNIKSGSGSVRTNSVFDFGTGVLHYKELGRLTESGAFYLGSAGGGQTNPSLSVANVTSLKKGSACDPYDASPLADYSGPSTICEFTDAANYTFSNKEELVRFHEKGSSCYNGIFLFQQNGLYGGIELQDVTKSGDLTYRYWYDASGGSDFSDACLLGKNSGSSALASVLDSLADVLEKIQREIKNLSR